MSEVQSRWAEPRRLSYLFIAGVLVLAGALHLGGALVAALFAFLALTKLHFSDRIRKWLPVTLFIVLLVAASYALGEVIHQAVRTLPEIADNAIPPVIQWARDHHLELPFSDYESLKDSAMDTVKGEAHYLGNAARIARGATTQFIQLLASVVVAIGVFIHPSFDLDGSKVTGDNPYRRLCAQIEDRFRKLYASFALVMGAQVAISAINTIATGAFVLVMHFPYAIFIIGATFLCGLIPIIGNLISNTIVVAIGITVSPGAGMTALVFLVVIHKFEYLLNSKIVGERIRNPFWLTLIALILGEKLMGIPGMILAPVILHYVRMEMSKP